MDEINNLACQRTIHHAVGLYKRGSRWLDRLGNHDKYSISSVARDYNGIWYHNIVK